SREKTFPPRTAASCRNNAVWFTAAACSNCREVASCNNTRESYVNPVRAAKEKTSRRISLGSAAGITLILVAAATGRWSGYTLSCCKQRLRAARYKNALILFSSSKSARRFHNRKKMSIVTFCATARCCSSMEENEKNSG